MDMTNESARAELISLAETVVGSSGAPSPDLNRFRRYAETAGVEIRAGGWVYLPGATKAIAQGWKGFAEVIIDNLSTGVQRTADAMAAWIQAADGASSDLREDGGRLLRSATDDDSLIGKFVQIAGDDPMVGLVVALSDDTRIVHVDVDGRRVPTRSENVSLLADVQPDFTRNDVVVIDGPGERRRWIVYGFRCASDGLYAQLKSEEPLPSGKHLTSAARVDQVSKVATSQTAMSQVSGPVVRLAGFALGDKVVVRDGDGRVWKIVKLAPATERAEAFAILEYGTAVDGSNAAFRLSRLAHAEASVPGGDDGCTLVARPTPGRMLHQQVDGRGLRPAPPVDLLAEFRALLDKAVKVAEAKPPQADLADVEVVGRIVRRAKYEALHAMLEILGGWVTGAQENCEAMEHGSAACHDDGRACGETFYVADIRNMVNDAARQVGTREPYRPEAT
jgi:hypothetical protein